MKNRCLWGNFWKMWGNGAKIGGKMWGNALKVYGKMWGIWGGIVLFCGCCFVDWGDLVKFVG